MKKKLKITGAILVMLLATLIITSVIHKKPLTYKKYNDIKFTQANQFQAKLGFNKTTKTEQTSYYIDNYTAKDSVRFINYVEFILNIAKEKYNIAVPKLKVTLTSDNSMSSSYTTVKFNPTTDKGEGILLSAVSKRKLPAWLCIGLERFWCNEANLKHNTYKKSRIQNILNTNTNKELPDFGDLWLVSDFMKEDKSDEVKNVFMDFVTFLNKKNQLEKVVAQYLSKKPDTKLVNDLWTQYMDTYQIKDLEFDDTDVYGYNGDYYINTEQAEYNFDIGFKGWKKICEYVDYMDNGIEYVKDWLHYKGDKRLYVQLLKKSDSLFGGVTLEYYPYNITLCHGEKSISGITHEATHALLRLMNQVPSSRAFEEGLCNMVCYNYEEKVRGLIYKEEYRYLADKYNQKLVDNDFILYKKFNKGKAFTLTDKLNMHAYVDSVAYEFIQDKAKDTESEEAYKRYFERKSSSDTKELRSYIDSTSFTYFLMDISGKEKFMSFMKNNNLFEKIYGKPVEDMIDDWYKYLGVKE